MKEKIKELTLLLIYPKEGFITQSRKTIYLPESGITLAQKLLKRYIESRGKNVC